MEQYGADEVLRLLSISFRDRKNTVVPCPRCGKMKFFFNREKNVGKCWSCEFHGNATSYFAEARGISTKEAHKEILQELGLWENRTNTFPKERKKASYKAPEFAKETPIADIEIRSKVYRAFLSHLSLSKKHHTDLMKRGLSEKEIETIGYKSYSLKSAIYAMNELVKAGVDFTGIPGFYKQDGNWRVVKMKEGILIPYLDFQRRISDCQIRKDDELIKKDSEKKEPKCLWFSSADKNCGVAAPAAYHLSVDWVFGQGGLSFRHKGSLYLTEGGMKGDISHIISGHPFISVPGVNALIELEKLFKSGKLQDMGIHTIYIAYDMDYLVNKHVANAYRRLCEMLDDYKFSHSQSTWNTENNINGKPLKGIDDYLAFHRRAICPR